MVLKKKYIHRNQEKGQAVSQLTLDDDFNISDHKPDVVKVIQDKGEIRLEEVRVSDGHVWVKGTLEFAILYKSDQSQMRIASLTGSIPFQENLGMDQVTETDTVKIHTQIEDLSIGIINSRKLNIRALVFLRASAETIGDEAVAYDIEEEEAVEKNVSSREVLSLIMAKRDNCRFKQEITLPSNKPNVSELLWKNVQIRCLDTRLKEGKIEVTGEVLVFVIYNGVEEEEKLQWMETVLPLRADVECALPEEELIAQIQVNPGLMELIVKPDYDGEERMLALDLTLDLDIHVWREEPVEVLEDLYSLKKNLIPEYEEGTLEKLLMKNNTKCRVEERMEIPREEGNILQICSCSGKAAVEKSRVTENGVEVEGTLQVQILFVTAEDASPIGAWETLLPFRQLIEADGITSDTRTELECCVEQLSAILLDGGNVEIKATVDLNLIAFFKQHIKILKEVKEEELNLDVLQKRPGITGYIVKEGDSMWNIAKENHTTVQNIIDTNELSGTQMKTGEKLLIVKAVS